MERLGEKLITIKKKKKRRQSSPVTGLGWPKEFQEGRVPR